MRSRRPGDRLHRVLTYLIDPQTLAEVIEPTLADLQYEVDRAGQHSWRRLLARVRGYCAVVRVLAGGGLHPTVTFTRALAIVGLSVSGAALMTFARWAPGSDSRPFVGAFLLPMFVTPVVLRRTGLGTSYSVLFACCAIIAMTMQGLDIVFYGLRAYFVYHVHLEFRLRDLIGLIVVLSTCSAVVALAAWQPANGRDPFARRLVVALFLGGLAAALIFGARAAWHHDAAPVVAAARAPFYLGLFGVLLAATAVPLLVARRWVRTPPGMAAMGALLSPATIVAQSYAEHGTLATCLEHFLRTPAGFMQLHLPVIAGAAVLGWFLASASPRFAKASIKENSWA